MNLNPSPRAIEMFNDVWDGRKEGTATVVLLEESIARLENQLAESVKKQNEKRPRLVHSNNRVVSLMEEVNNDPTCPLREASDGKVSLLYYKASFTILIILRVGRCSPVSKVSRPNVPTVFDQRVTESDLLTSVQLIFFSARSGRIPSST